MFRFARRITYLKYRESSGCRASILFVAATESSKSLHVENSQPSRIFSTTGSSQNTSLDDSTSLPKRGQLELDFFGEPVTFLGLSPDDKTQNAMAALDGFLLCVVSKGKTCAGGGEEAGIEVKSAHSAALSWAECLRHAAVWNQEGERSAPMLAVVAVAPVLAQAGIGYVKHLDTLLKQAKPGAPGLPIIQMHEIAARAVSHKDDTQQTQRARANPFAGSGLYAARRVSYGTYHLHETASELPRRCSSLESSDGSFSHARGQTVSVPVRTIRKSTSDIVLTRQSRFHA